MIRFKSAQIEKKRLKTTKRWGSGDKMEENKNALKYEFILLI
jgi:hypothetical protein